MNSYISFFDKSWIFIDITIKIYRYIDFNSSAKGPAWNLRVLTA